MPGNYYPDWDTNWATDSTLNGASIAGNANSVSGAISNDLKGGTEVSIEVAYGGTVSGGAAIVYLERDVDGTNYEAVADSPYSFRMPVTASTTHRRAITVPGHLVGKFRVRVANPNGNSTLTCTVRTRQQVGAYT